MGALRRRRLRIDGDELEVAVWGAGPPAIVLLHDGLGSIAQWRSVPGQLAARSGSAVLAYDRAGHGSSTPVPDGAWPPDWLHREAERLGGLLETAGAAHPLLVGHSDGGSIALLHAIDAGSSIRGVVGLAPHSWVEQVCVDAISDMRRRRAPVVTALGRHHRAPAELFEAWSGVWTGAAFRSWDIRPALSGVSTDVLVVQGSEDEYATADQAVQTADAVGPGARCRILPGSGHLLHHDDPATVLELVLAELDRTS